MLRKYQETAYRLLEGPADGDLPRKIVIAFLFILISLTVVIVILETETAFYAAYGDILWGITLFAVAVFSVEYLLRLWVCTVNPAYADPVRGRLRYLVTPLAIFDLLAILPFYIPLVLPMDLLVLRIFRLTRVFTVLKLGRFTNAWNSLTYTVRSRKEELLISAVLIFMVLAVSSTVMYYIENPAQPQKFSSIPHTMWWGVVTLSTVGYGDMYPITPLGKFVGSLVAISGIALFALPAGIIAAGLVESLHRRKGWDQDENGGKGGDSTDTGPEEKK
ncbi:MAG: ion transporter [Methanomicrobiales archaeon]|nr:ion transporter [Methanomicrobiales archaeon]